MINFELLANYYPSIISDKCDPSNNILLKFITLFNKNKFVPECMKIQHIYR